MKHYIKLGLIAFGLFAVFAFSACSSDEETTTTTEAPAAKEAPAKEAPKPTATSAPKKEAPAKEEAPAKTVTQDVVIGVPAICPPIFNNRFLTGSCFERVQMWGFTEGLTWMKHAPIPVQVDEDVPEKSMVESWEHDDTANTLTWTIREGIKFHNPDFGTVDAEDIAFSFNEAMAEGSTFNRAGQLRAWIVSIEAKDGKVFIQCKDTGCQNDWIRQQSNYNGQTASITSKDAFDSLGEEASLADLGNMTGPFHATKWVAGSTIVSDGVKDHWRHAPHLDTLTFVEIPETSVRTAALVNGEIHMSDLPPKFVAEAVEKSGGSAQQIGGGKGQGWFASGQFWAQTDYLGAAGEGNDPAARPGYMHDDEHPWIGEWGNDESMERAHKIRRAMGHMVDGEKLNAAIFGGLGSADPLAYFGWTPDMPEWKDEWFVDYDPDAAQALLDEAGYSDCFTVPYWIPPDVTVVIDPEFAEAVAQFWSDGGCKVEIEKTAYSARRPTLVSRDLNVFFAWNTAGAASPKDTNGVGPWVPRSGSWNGGFEFPDDLGKLHPVIDAEPDSDKRRAYNEQVTGFVADWHIFISKVESTPYWALHPTVESWTPYQGNIPYFGNPQTIKMKE